MFVNAPTTQDYFYCGEMQNKINVRNTTIWFVDRWPGNCNVFCPQNDIYFKFIERKPNKKMLRSGSKQKLIYTVIAKPDISCHHKLHSVPKLYVRDFKRHVNFHMHNFVVTRPSIILLPYLAS